MDQATPDSQDDLPEQMRVRRDKRSRLLAAGKDPYPAGFPRTARFEDILREHADLEPDQESGDRVTIAGRVIFLRNTGKLCFARLREGDGTELQVMLSLDRVGGDALAEWKVLIDLGDLVGVDGEVVRSRRGELSVSADAWRIVAKAIRPLPSEHHPLSDESRVRQRYADLIVNPESRAMVHARARVLASVRATLARHDFVEVETPVLQAVHGGAAARPFSAHVNALERDFYLRIALELHLKRLVVGGIERVYEIGRTFRNEGIDATHAPEFTMLEAYQAYGDCRSIAEVTRQIVVDAANALGQTVVADGSGGEVDLAGPWAWEPLAGLVSRAVGTVVNLDTPVETMRAIAEQHHVEVTPDASGAAILVELYEKLVEHTILATDVRLRLSGRDPAIGARPLRRPALFRRRRCRRRRGRARHALHRARRPGPAAGEARRTGCAGRCRRERDATRRGLSPRAGVRASADGRDGTRYRPPAATSHRRAVAAPDDHVSAVASRMITVRGRMDVVWRHMKPAGSRLVRVRM